MPKKINYRKKIAIDLRSPEEVKNGVSLYDSKFWLARKARIKREVAKREANQKETSRLRKEKIKNDK